MNRNALKPAFLALLAALVLAVPAGASKVKTWHHYATSNYEKAELKQALITSEGGLRLSRQLKPLAGLDATHVWDLVEDRDGNLVVATGGEGKIYKVAPDGKATVLYTSDDSQVLCLALGADGSVYAGTGPGGTVVRIDPKGKGKVFCETGESYVWALAVEKGGDLIAGTGPKGRVLRVSPEGKATVFYSTKQEHVLCVATGSEGVVFAGTDKGGLVYRIDAKGKGFVLYQAPQPEVRRVEVTPDGLYIATSAPTNRKRGGGTASAAASSSVASADTGKPAVASKGETAEKSAETMAVSEAKSSSSDSKESSKGSPASAPSAPSSGENSVYRIAFDGTVREVFREKTLVLSLLRQDGRFIVGTGMEGQLFEVDEATRERGEIARLDHGQILCMCRRKDGSVVLGTGDPGKLYVLQDRFTPKGTITSEVLDAKLISKWGALRWQAETPEGTAVSVAVRSGNVADPDETWSDWSVEQTDADRAIIAAPPARFLQYRVTLTADAKCSASPTVRSLTLRYATTNQAPEVTKVEVPDLNAVNLENPKKLKFKWSATDANEDELTYSLYVRKEGWSNWVLLEDDLDKTDYEWDTQTAPSGVYRLKVVASDRKDNPDGDALSAERTSAPFVVCHMPPAVTVKVVGVEGDQAVVEATASSPLVRLTAASFAVSGKKWVNVFPTDGLFDSKTETFRFKTESLKAGTHVLVLRVRDASGNLGSGDVVFTVKERPTK
jgi:hypothetical protein